MAIKRKNKKKKKKKKKHFIISNKTANKLLVLIHMLELIHTDIVDKLKNSYNNFNYYITLLVFFLWFSYFRV